MNQDKGIRVSRHPNSDDAPSASSPTCMVPGGVPQDSTIAPSAPARTASPEPAPDAPGGGRPAPPEEATERSPAAASSPDPARTAADLSAPSRPGVAPEGPGPRPDSPDATEDAPPAETLDVDSPLVPSAETLLPGKDQPRFPGGLGGRGPGGLGGSWPLLPDIPGYEIRESLGAGGMGMVYRAIQVRADRPVALKMIRGDVRVNPEHIGRFQAEAKAVAQLRDPHIVQIFDVGEVGGLPYFSMELLEGGTLKDRLAADPMPPDRAAELLGTLARAVDSAHRARIVHRDLKPGNVLFDADGTPKISDFGLAKRLDDDSHTITGQVMGTPSYMAPEQARGENHTVGPRTDVYALGAIFYEALTGRPPFKGATTHETIAMVIDHDPVSPSKFLPRVPRDLETICLKCLAKDPARRYGSALELAEDLDLYLVGLPIKARPAPPWEHARKWARRHPAAATLLTLTLLAAAVVGGVARHREALRREAQRREDFRLASKQVEINRSLFDAQGLLAHRKWDEARELLNGVVVDLNAERGLAELRTRAGRLLVEARQGLDADAAREAERERFRRFARLRNEALFHDTQFSGLDLPTNQGAIRRSVRDALALFTTTGPGDAWRPASAPATYTRRERTEISEGIYELLLVLAGATPEPDGGLRILDQAPQFHPPTRALHLRREACLLRRGDRDAAEAERRRADLLPPASAFDHFLTGREHYKRGEWQAALRDFDAALLLRPDHFWAHCLSAVCALKLQRAAEARAALTACLQAEPEFAWLYVLRGFASAQLATSGGDDAEEAARAAEADYARALERLDRAPNAELRYAVLVNRGLLGLQRRRWQEARADLRDAIALDGRRFQAYAALAQVCQAQGRPEEAVEQFGRAIAARPDWAPLYRGRADVYLDVKEAPADRRRQALQDLEEAIRLEAPGNPVLARDQTNRARLLRRDGLDDEAIRACDAALAIVPDYAAAHRVRIGALLQRRRYAEVIRSCDALLAKGPPAADLHELRGLARAALEDTAGALEDVSQTLAVGPRSARLLVRRGWLHLLAEAPRPALRDFDEAIALDPGYADAHHGRGAARVLLGDHRGAMRDVEQALRLGTPTARRSYLAARAYLRAAAAAPADGALGARDAARLAEKYRDRAVALALEALDRTPADERAAFARDVLYSDPAFRPILRRLRSARLALAAKP